MPNQPLYRQAALDRLASPDQLDRLLAITSPRAWLALLGAAAVIVAGLAWGIFGTLPITVPASCILLPSSGVTAITSTVSGQITDVRPVVGDEVHRGEVIARVAQPSLVHEINRLQDTLATERGSDRQKIQTQIDALQLQLDLASRVVSPYDGRVVSVDASLFDMVNPGTAIVDIEEAGGQIQALQAVTYIPIGQRTLVSPGMPVEIAVSTAQKEKYGLLLGDVVSVSPLPATPAQVSETVGSPELAAALIGGGPSAQSRVELVPDPTTPSGYGWTSAKGPPYALAPGTVCRASITVATQRPISMLIPGL